jgi:hypothetical protein
MAGVKAGDSWPVVRYPGRISAGILPALVALVAIVERDAAARAARRR